jgi:hypothetical protein
MPEIVSKDWLERMGVSSNLTAKALHALRYLGLIDDKGYTTEAAQRLRTATSEEYPSVLEEIIRKAYRKVFEVRNPSVDSRTRVDDAFRQEQPQAQRSRMVACFLGLCSLAGIPLKEAPPVRDLVARRSPPASAGVKRPRESPVPQEPPPPEPRRATPTHQATAGLRFPTVSPVLAGLLETVGGLETAEDLDEWFQVFRAAFVFVRNQASKNKSEAGT